MHQTVSKRILSRAEPVGLAIPVRIEICDGPVSGRLAGENMAHQRIDLQAGNVSVGIEVPVNIEQGVRLARLTPADAAEMLGCVQRRRVRVDAVDQTVVRVNRARGLDDRKV